MPWNMLNVMNPTAARSCRGAKPRRECRAERHGEFFRERRSAPIVPSHTMGSTRKYSVAMAALAHIARGTFVFGSIVSPT